MLELPPFMNKQLIAAMVVAGGCTIAIVFAWILLMISWYHLSFAKIYGQRQQQTCGKEYLERETARYEIDGAYTSKVGKFIEISMTTLFTICMIPIIVAVGIVLTFLSAEFNNSGKKKKKLAYAIVSALIVFAVLAGYLLFFINEVSHEPTSKYLNQFSMNPTMRRTKIITIAVSIIIALWIAVIAYKIVHTTDEVLPVKLDDYQQIATAFTVIVVVTAAIIITMDGDRQRLKVHIDGKYGTTKNNLQKTALSLISYPDFVKYLQINIKRSNHTIEGNPDVTKEPYLDQLYSYLEHRPGNNQPMQINFKYMKVKGIKEVFAPFIEGATTERNLLLSSVLSMYVDMMDDDYLFEKSDIQQWLTHKYLFQGKEVQIVQPIMQLIDEMGTNTNNTGVTTTTLTSVLYRVLNQPNRGNDNSNNRPPVPVCTPQNRAACKISYANPLLQTATSSATTTNVNVNISLTSDDRTKIETALAWFIYFSTYKDDTLMTFDSVYQQLDAMKTIHVDTIANLRAAFKRLENDVGINSSVYDIQTFLRDARSVEGEVVGVVDEFLSHVNIVTVGVIGLAVYAIMHYLYQLYPGQLVTAVGIMVLLGVFTVTWYAWFFAKLKL